MKIFTIMLIILYNIIFIYQVIKKKNIFGLGTIINFAVNLNFILYLARWSNFIKEEPYFGTYVLIDSIIIIFIIIMIYSKSPIDKLIKNKKKIIFKDIRFTKKNISLYVVINIIYIGLFLVENLMGSGNIFPYLFGIDIHTYSAPLISFVTRAVYVMIFLNYICFNSFKEKKYIIFLLIDILLFPVLRGARMNVFVAFIQFGLFFVMYNLNIIKKNKKITGILLAMCIVVVIGGVIIGNKRVDSHLEGNELQGQVGYEDYIQYSGPEDPLGILPWYYGYFPMSYANLDLTLRSIDNQQLRTYGTYSLRPILVGMFQFDNLIPNYKDINYLFDIEEYYTPSASVRTGFLEFYLDFGYFAFLPIAIYAFIGLIFYNKIRENIYFLAMYAFYAGCWFFMSFQNTMLDVTTFYGLIYLYIIYRFCVVKKYAVGYNH